MGVGVVAAAASFHLTADRAATVLELYRPIPWLYLTFLLLWSFSTLSWSLNTWRNRHRQTSYLQLLMASVPLIKALQLEMLLLFWYSCTHSQICTLWTYGVYGTGVLFHTASFVSFLLIAHGYYIMYARAPESERCVFAGSGSGFLIYMKYLRTLKLGVPYFTYFLSLSFCFSFYAFLHRISGSPYHLHEQPGSIEDEAVRTIHDTNNTIFKKFRVAILIGSLVEVPAYILVDETPDNLWFHVLVREGVQFCILLYIGWTFRMREGSPNFFIMRNWKLIAPPTYSVEMDADDFNDLKSQESHIGQPTPFPPARDRRPRNPLPVIVQHPRVAPRRVC